jgi:hypothetical protein
MFSRVAPRFAVLLQPAFPIAVIGRSDPLSLDFIKFFEKKCLTEIFRADSLIKQTYVLVN